MRFLLLWDIEPLELAKPFAVRLTERKPRKVNTLVRGRSTRNIFRRGAHLDFLILPGRRFDPFSNALRVA